MKKKIGSEINMRKYEENEVKEKLDVITKISMKMFNGEIKTVEEVGKIIETTNLSDEDKVFLLSYLISERYVKCAVEYISKTRKQNENIDMMYI